MKVMILGGDGYLGWSIGLDRAFKTDDTVILVDAYFKRMWQDRVCIKELFQVPYFEQRIITYRKITGKNNLIGLSIDISNFSALRDIIIRYKPDIIINAAQQPSAPYSMMDPEKAAFTLSNNEKTCLNTLWAVAQYSPETFIIQIGSAGVYLSIDSDFIPKSKVNLSFDHFAMPHRILNSWIPMQASDFYHQSKAHTFALTDIAVKLWNLTVVTVQQSTIFGHCVDKDLDHPDLYTRFNYDHIFGTVLNRFICQAVVGHPLTIYGDGQLETGLCNLCDAIQIYNNLIEHYKEYKKGVHHVEHNFTSKIKLNDAADKIAEYVPNTKKIFLKNPRKEEKLKQNKIMEKGTYNNITSFDHCIIETLDFVKKFSNNIELKYILPTVQWDIND